jgi:hypothetical protein
LQEFFFHLLIPTLGEFLQSFHVKSYQKPFLDKYDIFSFFVTFQSFSHTVRSRGKAWRREESVSMGLDCRECLSEVMSMVYGEMLQYSYLIEVS